MGNVSQTTLSVWKKVSKCWWPYVELMRVRVFTTIIMYSPYLYGSLFAASVSAERISFCNLLSVNAKLLLSAVLSHSWACTWNDVADYELDRKVKRCRDRPIARGAVTPRAGFLFTIAQILVWLQYHALALPQFFLYGVFAAVLAILYPFSKRVTNYTPIALGAIFAWGTLLGFVATQDGRSETHKGSQEGLGLFALSSYTLVWVVNFETIYAFQDVRDDMKAGIKSMAVWLKQDARPFLILTIFVQALLLSLTGRTMQASVVYYLLVPLGNTCLQLWTQLRTDLTNPAECTAFFKKTPVITTALITTGLVYECFSQRRLPAI